MVLHYTSASSGKQHTRWILSWRGVTRRHGKERRIVRVSVMILMWMRILISLKAHSYVNLDFSDCRDNSTVIPTRGILNGVINLFEKGMCIHESKKNLILLSASVWKSEFTVRSSKLLIWVQLLKAPQYHQEFI